MKTLLVLPRFEPNSNPPLGLAYIAAAMRNAGQDVEILDPTFEGRDFALRIIALLKARGIPMRVFDPHVHEAGDAESLASALKGANVVLLLTHHTALVKSLDAKTLKNAGIKVVVDARNVLDRNAIASEGIVYKGIGR